MHTLKRVVRAVNRFWSTLIAFAAGALLFASHVQWIEFNVQPQAGDIRPAMLAACVVIAGIALDWSRARQRKRLQSEIEEAKLRTLRATMRTVQHLVNTFLNDLILLEVEAANTLPQEMLDRLDDRVQDIAKQLKALGDVTSVREKRMGAEVGVDYAESND